MARLRAIASRPFQQGEACLSVIVETDGSFAALVGTLWLKTFLNNKPPGQNASFLPSFFLLLNRQLWKLYFCNCTLVRNSQRVVGIIWAAIFVNLIDILNIKATESYRDTNDFLSKMKPKYSNIFILALLCTINISVSRVYRFSITCGMSHHGII